MRPRNLIAAIHPRSVESAAPSLVAASATYIIAVSGIAGRESSPRCSHHVVNRLHLRA